MANERRMSAMYMSNARQYEVQRMNHFEVLIEGLSNVVVPLAVESFSLPDVSISPIELAHGNTKVKVAGLADTPDSSLTVKDFIVPDIEGLLYDWFQQVYEFRTGKIGWASVYKKNATFYEYAPDGTNPRVWKLIGMWPSTMTFGEFGYESGDKRQISTTLQVDQSYRER